MNSRLSRDGGGPDQSCSQLSTQEASSFDAPDPAVMLDILEQPEGHLSPTDSGTADDHRDAILLGSLRKAYARMVSLQGSDPAQWAWGNLHNAFIAHPLSSAFDESSRTKADIGPLFVGGDFFTVNQSRYRNSDFRLINGPSFRMIVDVGHWDQSKAVNFPWQSGDPESPHYKDLMAIWQNGGYFPMLYTRKEIEAAAETRLLLLPE